MEDKKLLFSVTIKDCDVDTFTVSGPGGSGKDTSQTGVRVTHRESGAVGRGTETRSYKQNRESAFVKMANSEVFKLWHKKEVSRRMNLNEESITTDYDKTLKTYNFKASRVKNHKTGNIGNLKEVLNGELLV